MELNDYIEFSEDSNNNKSKEKDLSNKEKYPWLSKITTQIKNVNIRLHNEIIDFYNFIKPNKFDIEKRNLAIKELENNIRKEFDDFKWYSFGSFKTKLFLKNSDLDICLMNEYYSSKKLLFKIYNIIKGFKDVHYKNIQTFPNAKVPILKFYDIKNEISIDIVFNKKDGIIILDTIMDNINKYKQMKYIILIMKFFLKSRGINDTYTGGIGSFLLYNMVRYFLKSFLTTYIKNNEYKLSKINDISLSQFFLEFLEFYIFSFDYYKYEIHMKDNPKIKIRNTKEDCFFSLYSPLDENLNIGSAAFNFKNIIFILRNRYCLLKNKDLSNDVSILKYFINSDDKEFSLDI